MSIQNGVLVIISGVKRYFSNHILGSLRFRIILLVVLFGAVPALIMQAVILNSYETRAVDVRTAEIQNQCTILCNQLGSRGTLNGRADESIQTELVQMSNIYDGRVLVIDNNFQVEEDTYDMDIGRTIVSADVIRCLEGTGTSRYDEENAYIEVTSPVYDPSGEHVLGVLLVSVSTDSIEDNLAVLTGKAAVAWITMTLVVLVLAFLLAYHARETLPSYPVGKMGVRQKSIARAIKKRLNRKNLVDVLKLSSETEFGSEMPATAVFIAPDLASGFIAIENLGHAEKLDRSLLAESISGI